MSHDDVARLKEELNKIQEENNRIQEENNRIKEENKKNQLYKDKYISVIDQLSNIDPASVKTDQSNSENSTTNGEKVDLENNLLQNADAIVGNVVSSFKTLPAESQGKVLDIKNEGSQFLLRLQMVEQQCSHTAYNAKLALNKVEEIEQYLKIDHLQVHGLDDIPVKKNGLEFSTYVADKLKELLPELPFNAEKILNNISVSHPIKSRKRRNNIIVLIKFSNRDMRNKIFFAKKALKGTNISITEHLTPATLELLALFRNRGPSWSLWSQINPISE